MRTTTFLQFLLHDYPTLPDEALVINHIKEEINFDWGRLLEDLHRLSKTLTETNPRNMFSLNLSFLPQVELPRASPNCPPEGLPVHPRQVGQSSAVDATLTRANQVLLILEASFFLMMVVACSEYSSFQPKSINPCE